MVPHANLEKLYSTATEAIAKKDYDRATSLLKQILIQDETFKDASRLLAQLIQHRRRRWYTSPFLYGGVGLFALILLGFFLVPLLQSTFATQISTQAIKSTNKPAPTNTPTLNPTPIPLKWKRINIGTQFPRDAITTIAIDPKDSLVIFIGTAYAGIYKTIDGGLSWQPVQNGLMRAAITRLVFDPMNADILYASTQGRLFKTTNGGMRWEELSQNRDFRDSNTFIVIDPQNNQILYYASQDSVYRSTDSGINWQTVKSQEECPGQIYSHAFIGHPTKSGVLYASQWDPPCPTGLYRSTDGGQIWELIGLEGKKYIGQIAIGLDFRGNEVLYASNEDALFASRDDGKTWTNILDGGCPEILLVDKNQPTIVYCGLSKSMDGGYSWDTALSDPPYGLMSMAFPDDGSYIIAGTPSGAFISTDAGASWTESNNGIAGTFLDLRLDPSDPFTFYINEIGGSFGGSKLYHSSDSAQSWDFIERGQGFDIGGNGEIYRIEDTTLLSSQDNGKTWISFSLPVSSGEVVGLGTNLTQERLVFVVKYPQQLFFSSNLGALWDESTLPKEENSMGNVRFYFSTNQGQFGYMVPFFGALRTVDGGNTWSSCGDIQWIPDTHSVLVIDPRDSNKIMIAILGQGLLMSGDGCQTWTPSNDGLDSLFVNSIAIDPNHPETLYAGTDGGAYVSFDFGTHWGKINDGLLGAMVVYSIVVDPQSNVYAATPYGIFKLEGK